MEADRLKKKQSTTLFLFHHSNLATSNYFLFGFYCWDWEFLTALLLFSCLL
ncbi:hypothetical protein LINPERHAP1_LOCUS27184 [Linum perenne]